MRLYCKEHGYMDEKTGPMAECPYCRVDELTAERDALKADLSGRYFVDEIRKQTASRCADIIEDAGNCDEIITYEELANAIRKEFNL